METPKMNTLMMTNEIEKCESIDDFKKLFVDGIYKNNLSYVDWKKKFSILLKERSLTATDIANSLNISKASATRFISRIPSRRRNVIMLAMVFGMNLDETNELLVRWAKFQKLYVKNPEDAIWIYLINNKKFHMPALAFDALYTKYLDTIAKDKNGTVRVDMNTHFLDAELLRITNDSAFIDWMAEQLPVHKACCYKLITYIDALLENESINQWFGGDETLKRDKYYRKIRELKENNRVPERDFLISLGLHLKLGTGKINELLDAAGMGPLLAKDQLEGLIMFFIEELYCCYPSMFVEDDDLSSFFLIDDDPNAMDENGQPLEFPADTLADYVKCHIAESGIDFKDKERVKELLELI